MFDYIKTEWRQKNGVSELVLHKFILEAMANVMRGCETTYTPWSGENVLGYIKAFDSGRAMSAFDDDIMEHESIVAAKEYADKKYGVKEFMTEKYKKAIKQIESQLGAKATRGEEGK